MYVKSCSVCNRQKKPQKKPKAHQVLYHAGLPLERIHIDILGPLIETPRGNQNVLVVVDQFSKWVECYALSDQTAERVARTLVLEFNGRCGCPLEFHSDQGRNFESLMFKEVCDLQTTQPTSGGAVTANSSYCANCVEPPRPQQWGPDLPFFGHAGHADPLDGWRCC